MNKLKGINTKKHKGKCCSQTAAQRSWFVTEYLLAGRLRIDLLQTTTEESIARASSPPHSGQIPGKPARDNMALRCGSKEKKPTKNKVKKNKGRKFIPFVTVVTMRLTQLLRLLHNKNIQV